jgi:hypothetical protein
VPTVILARASACPIMPANTSALPVHASGRA